MKQSNKRLPLGRILVRLLKKAAPAKGLLVISTLSGILNSLCHAGLMAFGALMVLRAYGCCAGSLRAYGAGMLLCALGIFVFRYLDGVISHTAAYYLLAQMRGDMYAVLRRLAPAGLTGQQKGDTLAVAIGDIETIEHFFAHTIGPIFTVLLLPIAVILAAGATDLRLIPVLVPIYLFNSIVLPLCTVRLGEDIGRRYRSALGSLKSLILESVQGIRDVQIFRAGERRTRLILDKTREISSEVHRLTLFRQVVSSVPSFFIYLMRLGFVIIASGLIRGDSSMATRVIVLSFLISSVFSSTTSLVGVAAGLIETVAAAERIFALEDREPEIREAPDAMELEPIRTVEFENVGFSYESGREPVLSGLNIRMEPGQCIGICGESGAGKSTILRLLLRFWNPTEGQILINGQPADRYSTESLRRRIGLMEQDTFLFNDTIAANIAVSRPDATPEEIQRAAELAGIRERIESLPEGFATPMGEMGDRLSGGEKQRIGIARLLLADPDVIVMDEPTSNLDAFLESGLLHTLEHACRGKLLILVSHRRSTLSGCSRIFELQNGRFAELVPDEIVVNTAPMP